MHVKKKLCIAVLLLLVVIIIGMFGYLIIVDTFYMTVITVSSVGFGLILPFSIEAELFIIFLLFLSVFYADTCLKYYLKIVQWVYFSKNKISTIMSRASDESSYKKLQQLIM